jgi:hypothetical protein
VTRKNVRGPKSEALNYKSKIRNLKGKFKILNGRKGITNHKSKIGDDPMNRFIPAAKLTHLDLCVTLEFRVFGAAAYSAGALWMRWAYHDGQF